MARGRKRLPSKILDARGAFTKDPQRRREDVEVDEGLGDPFSWLPPEAAAVWVEVAGKCPPGWLVVTDRYAFARYCQLIVKLIASDLTGEDTRFLAQLEARFGFTPTERTRIQTNGKGKTKDPLREALGL
jgi:hypothetical protein